MTGQLLDRLGLRLAREARPLLAALCVNAVGAGMFYPFALLFFTGATSLSVGRIGLILTVTTLITLSVTPVTGALVDRFGPRRLVVASQVLGAGGFGGYLFVTSGTTLFLASLLVTAASRMFFASYSALVAQFASGKERDRWYGLIGVAQSLASSVSGFVVSLVLSTAGAAGFRAVISGNVICLLVSGLLVHRLAEPRRNDRPPRGHERSGYRTVLRDVPFLKIVASNGLIVLCPMLLGVGLVIYVKEALHAPLWVIGSLGVFQTALVVGCQGVVLRKVESRRRIRVMLSGGGVWVVACALMATAVTLPSSLVVPWLFISIAGFTFAQLLYMPTARALAAGMGQDTLQGRYIAVYEFSWGLAAALGPGLFGAMFELHPAAPWLLMSVIVLCAMVVLRSAEARMPGSLNRPVRVEHAGAGKSQRVTSD